MTSSPLPSEAALPPLALPGAAEPAGNNLFPIFLKLEKFRVLVVGGGAVGLEKLAAILGNSPATAVTVVSETFLPGIVLLAEAHPQVQLRYHPYTHTDLVGHDIVFVATDNPVLNRGIKAHAAELGLLCNVADTPDECDFYLGSIVQKGDLKIAISTNGKSPTVAKRLRTVLADALPNELQEVLQHMTIIRGKLAGDFANKVKSLNAVTAELAGGPAYESPA
ncbi:bifunctional precorrin-2 dehydrogenase/sirohydrochlorin ferrochelatase, partial [Hymenobacter sp. BT635]